jgi:hypothetical protein
MNNAVYAAAPGFWLNLFTLGIVQAKWVAAVNSGLRQGGAGFLFAWFLAPFANYGLANRLNAAHQALGSSIRISPLACFFFTGWAFIGARKRLKRSGQAYGSMLSARASVIPAAI